MNTKLRSLVLSLLLTAAVCVATVSAQTATPAATAPAESGALSALPASDLVIYANMRRIMTELAPHIMAHDPAMLGKVMGAIEMVKAKTGVNVMGIERVAVGLRLLGPIGPQFKKENLGIVIIAYGDFDANAFTTFAKAETKGKMSEQTYGGKIVYSEPAPEPPKTKSERERPAFAVLDANTLAIGDLVEVRAAVDAAAGTGRLDPALARLATEDENALVGVGVNFSPSVAQHLSASVGPEEVAQAGVRLVLSTLKQLSLSAGVGPGTFNMALGARFCNEQQAQAMADVLLAARRQAAVINPKLSGLLEGVQVRAEGSDVRIRAEIKGEALKSLGEMFAARPEGASTPRPPQLPEGSVIDIDPALKKKDTATPAKPKVTKRRRARRRGR